jgi:hypothetical protein
MDVEEAVLIKVPKSKQSFALSLTGLLWNGVTNIVGTMEHQVRE